MDERNNHFDFDFTPIGQAIHGCRDFLSFQDTLTAHGID